MSEQWTGGDRFAVESCLGEGGFGVVYLADDRQRHARVAIKILRQPDAAAVYRLKQEFRALADLSHPNLVSLYELVSDGDRWIITMELVEGKSFIEFVRGEATDEVPTSDSARITVSMMGQAGVAEDGPARAPAAGASGRLLRPSGVNLARLDSALGQLAEGLAYLHRAGKLHCDIKPSNVLVTSEGRVVLLDFGLVTELAPASEAREDPLEVLGSPAYMSPEQGVGRGVSEASDWYSVGVMLFEALTGERPYRAGGLEVLREKLAHDAPVPSSLVAGVPPTLDALCRDLLARDPRARPTGAQVLERLGIGRRLGVQTVAADAPFVGRRQQLDALAGAFRTATGGQTVIAYVHGSSGIGKSALVRRFLQELRDIDKQAVVLAGRCYERESVPYKALDSLVDALSQHLRRLPDAEVRDLLPSDILALARLFPTLRRVEAVVESKTNVLELADSQELRRRAFAALRELLARLASRQPVVLFIDDLQWGDADSAALLADLLRPPDPPPLLLIACYRTEEADSSLLLRALGSLRSTRSCEVPVGELPPKEARELAITLAGGRGAIGSAELERLVRESAGNPFLIDELMWFARAGQGAFEAGPLPSARATETTLEEVIKARVAGLAEPARRLVEILAVFGRPLDLTLASRAARLGSDELNAVAALRAAHLTRTRLHDEREQIETYHDRIRETVVAQLAASSAPSAAPSGSSGALQAHHRRLAVTLEAAGGADPEALAVHFQGCGDTRRAADYAVAAAAQAREALAFDRAARLYRLALDLQGGESRGRQRLHAELGRALASAGRGLDAARAFLAAAARASAGEKLELERRAAELLLRSGHIDEGIAAIRRVLATIGMKLAATPRRALLSLILQRARLALRGLGFRERDRSQISPEELIRIDTCWAVAVSLGIVDTIRGADFQARHLLLALRAGEPSRVARALALEACYASTAGSRSLAHTERLVRDAVAIAVRLNDPNALGFATLASGFSDYFSGRWRRALDRCERAEVILREECTGFAWELDSAHLYWLLSLYYLGELKEMSRRLPRIIKEAQERGDLVAATSQRTRIAYLVFLAEDRVAQAREEVRQGIQLWSHHGFHAQHYFELFADVEIALYSGDDLPAAWASIVDRWPALQRSLLLRVQTILIEALHLRARAALAAAMHPGATGDARKALLRQAGADARRIEREETAWGTGLARLVRAGLAAADGDVEAAIERLTAAEQIFDATDMRLYAAAARLRRGQLAGGSAGQTVVAEARAWMAAQSVRDPDRMALMLAPLAPGRFIAPAGAEGGDSGGARSVAPGEPRHVESAAVL